MVNSKKNKILKSIWFQNEKEYKKLKDALDGNYGQEVLDIMYEIYLRGDI